MTQAPAEQGPIRTCVGCRSRRPKSDLIRLALDAQERVVWDLKQSMPGRGAYLCPASDCLAGALKRRRLNRAFRRHVDTNVLEKNGIPLERKCFKPEAGKEKQAPVAGTLNG